MSTCVNNGYCSSQLSLSPRSLGVFIAESPPYHHFVGRDDTGLVQRSHGEAHSSRNLQLLAGAVAAPRTPETAAKQLRFWLPEQIDSGTVSGLIWLDRERRIFRIPWKHVGANNWTPNDSEIFKRWAEHKGRFTAKDQPDYANWKTNFRCALNKLKDVRELHDQTNLHCAEPYKVFQFERESNPHHPTSFASQFPQSPTNTDRELISTPPFDHQVNNIENCQPNSPEANSYVLLHPPSLRHPTEIRYAGTSTVLLECNALHEVILDLRYRGVPVFQTTTTNPHGFRIYYDHADVQEMACARNDFPINLTGPEELQQVKFVECPSYITSLTQLNTTKEILHNLSRGLVVQLDNNCFYATRLCRSRIFVLGPESDPQVPEKLERLQTVKIFDFCKFVANLKKYVRGETRRHPMTEIKISFAQKWSALSPIDHNFVTLSFVPRAAMDLLSKVREQHLQLDMDAINNSIEMSCKDSQDEFVDQAIQSTLQYLDNVMEVINCDGICQSVP